MCVQNPHNLKDNSILSSDKIVSKFHKGLLHMVLKS